LTGLASLKLTVTLFFLAIVLIFVGTLAQVDKDVWQVVDGYFRSVVAWIDFQVFFPRSFFPQMSPVSGGFWFPGGWTIGVAMAVNLVAAHLMRFRIQARGLRLAVGLTAIAAGAALTWLVIAGGHNQEGLQAVSGCLPRGRARRSARRRCASSGSLFKAVWLAVCC
jgi:hypothetical protein